MERGTACRCMEWEIWCMGYRKKREERVLRMISSVEINILLLLLLLKEYLERKKKFQPLRCDLCKRISTPVRSKGFWLDQNLMWISVETNACAATRDLQKISMIISSRWRLIHAKVYFLFIFFYLIFVSESYIIYDDLVYGLKIWSYACLY